MELAKTLPINQFPRHLFWSYEPDAKLPVRVLIKQVLTYGDIDDMKLLVTIVSKKTLTEILDNEPLNTKRLYFFRKIFLEL
jgi:hypothetical protein